MGSRTIKVFNHYVVVIFLALGCSWAGALGGQNGGDESDLESSDGTRSFASSLTATKETTEAFPSPTLVPDTGWRILQDGLEERSLNLKDHEGHLFESIYFLRVNPDYYRFDVAYRPGEPLSLVEWQAKTGALVVVNGGFFTETFEATGVIVSGGRHHGVSYQGFGGMFVVNPDGPELRWLTGHPYEPGEPILAGLQSFPMLIRPGGYDFYIGEDVMRARRTVIAQDRQGRFILIIAKVGGFTLGELAQFLVESDLDLDRALNLDGGASTGLKMSPLGPGIDAYSLLPAIIAIYPSG